MILHVRYVELVPDHDEGAALIGVQEAHPLGQVVHLGRPPERSFSRTRGGAW